VQAPISAAKGKAFHHCDADLKDGRTEARSRSGGIDRISGNDAM